MNGIDELIRGTLDGIEGRSEESGGEWYARGLAMGGRNADGRPFLFHFAEFWRKYLTWAGLDVSAVDDFERRHLTSDIPERVAFYDVEFIRDGSRIRSRRTYPSYEAARAGVQAELRLIGGGAMFAGVYAFMSNGRMDPCDEVSNMQSRSR